MKTYSSHFRLINGYSVLINRKVASCAIGRAACFAHHPEILAKVTTPEGAKTPVYFWLGCLPVADPSKHPVVALFRDPVGRFVSACDYSSLSWTEGFRLAEEGQSSHFTKQCVNLPKGALLYRMDRDFEAFARLLGLENTIEQINRSMPKLSLTAEETSAVSEFYKEDVEIYNSITQAGYIYGI